MPPLRCNKKQKRGNSCRVREISDHLFSAAMTTHVDWKKTVADRASALQPYDPMRCSGCFSALFACIRLEVIMPKGKLKIS
jgi:hypothetical protein